MKIQAIIEISNEFYRIATAEYLYHITLYRNLSSIAANGLVGGNGVGIGAGGNAGHSKGRLFVTDKSGLRFWYMRAQEHAENRYDDLFVSEAVPIVLRWIEKDQTYEYDDPGSNDSKADAWFTTDNVDPNEIECFDGMEWIPLTEWKSIDLTDALDMDEDGTVWFKSIPQFLPTKE